MDNPDNTQWDEQFGIVRRLNNRDQQAQVILNLTDKKVEKNSFQTGKNFNEVFEYFFVTYNEHLTKVMAQIDPTYLTELVDRMQKELDSTSAEKTDEKIPA